MKETRGGSETLGKPWLETCGQEGGPEPESASRGPLKDTLGGVDLDQPALSLAHANEAVSHTLFAALAPIDGVADSTLTSALGRIGLIALSRADSMTLRAETSLSVSKCEQLAAVFELGRRVEEERWSQGDSVRTSGGVYRLMAPQLRGLDRETFIVLLLDGRHRLIHHERVSEGTLTTSLVHPREVFRPAIRHSAAAIVVVHNHPSGDPEPSRQDYDVTRRLADCGRLVGIPLLDHVVIGHGAHVSIKDRIEF